MRKWVYRFGNKSTEGHTKMHQLLGGKGAGLAEMSLLGIPVPPGFTIITPACQEYYATNKSIPITIKEQIEIALADLEQHSGLKLADAEKPFLISVRSGAQVSMPGMMDTILNLGLNDQTMLGLAKQTKNIKFAYDSYRRFIQMYGGVVLGIDYYQFESVLENHKRKLQIKEDKDIDPDSLLLIIKSYKELVRSVTGKDFPQDIQEQFWSSIAAVFNSWNSDRAIKYRQINKISHNLGTAVIIQAMVFGNMGEQSATGVAFTRDPKTGAKEIFGEYLINAQGEDIVAGIRTPQQLSIAGKKQNHSNLSAMEEVMPEIFSQLLDITNKLERYYLDMQDVEFTIQQGKIWILQTRTGKRTVQAALKIAIDMMKEGLIGENEAIKRIDPSSIEKLLHPTLDLTVTQRVLTKGLPASPGAASGAIVFSSTKAELLARQHKVILVRYETSPDDIGGMYAAEGVLTIRGGMTSHAAVVARGMGKPCICGALDIRVDYEKEVMQIGDIRLKEGDIITINGATGEVILGEVATIKPQLSDDFKQIMKLAEKKSVLEVRANAETPIDAKTALDFGANGIGLCRTEHMFFDPKRIISVRRMILAQNKEERKQALECLLPYQKEDFKQIFAIMQELPVTIRLLDPPLHEFLPADDKEIADFAHSTGYNYDQVQHKIKQLIEVNPMLGHRGCRLAITFPEIYEMQVNAIFEAVIELINEQNIYVVPEIMVPLVMDENELVIIKAMIDKIAANLKEKYNVNFAFKFGAMIELPRAALRADKICKIVDFCSFGTNDLTQTTLGISRDDAGSFLPDYKYSGILKNDPFVSIDVGGVGELIAIAVKIGKEANPKVKFGVCGEHGGDPWSIIFWNNLGLDYVSCSPYRVPIAKIAAAQAVLQ